MPNWNVVLDEIEEQLKGNKKAYDDIRRKYLRKLHEYTGRNTIAYYSGFLTNPQVHGISITDEDKNGFMACIHKLDKSKGLDLLLHTPGGDIAATESLVHYLKGMFKNDIRAIIPQIAMSAGTILACSCKSIVMGKHSNIGPVDPQISGIPCLGVLTEFKKAYEEIRKDNKAAMLWNPILSRLSPSFLQQCEWAIQRSEDLLKDTLKENMLSGLNEHDQDKVVEKILERLTNLEYNKSHDRHIHYQECQEIGLKIEMLEDPNNNKFQDLVLTVHHSFMHTLSNTAAIKIIEDHSGRAMIRNVPPL